jgi:aspartate/methionine/tyrosine aminotransferase
MLYGGKQHRSILHYPDLKDRAILLDGWSKTYAMTGWRLGYAVWPPSLIEQATRLAINDHSCVNASAQFAGLAALEGTQDVVEEMVATFDLRRKVTLEALNDLPGISCVEPGGAFYAFPNIRQTGYSSAALQDNLLEEAHVATLAGSSFGDGGEGYLRISYANSKENILKSIERVKRFLKK